MTRNRIGFGKDYARIKRLSVLCASKGHAAFQREKAMDMLINLLLAMAKARWFPHWPPETADFRPEKRR
jgi:hypothetical protein